MLVKLTQPYLIHERGSIVDYPKNVAEALIQSHRAVAHVEPSAKKLSNAPRNKAFYTSERK